LGRQDNSGIFSLQAPWGRYAGFNATSPPSGKVGKTSSFCLAMRRCGGHPPQGQPVFSSHRFSFFHVGPGGPGIKAGFHSRPPMPNQQVGNIPGAPQFAGLPPPPLCWTPRPLGANLGLPETRLVLFPRREKETVPPPVGRASPPSQLVSVLPGGRPAGKVCPPIGGQTVHPTPRTACGFLDSLQRYSPPHGCVQEPQGPFPPSSFGGWSGAKG